MLIRCKCCTFTGHSASVNICYWLIIIEYLKTCLLCCALFDFLHKLKPTKQETSKAGEEKTFSHQFQLLPMRSCCNNAIRTCRCKATIAAVQEQQHENKTCKVLPQHLWKTLHQILQEKVREVQQQACSSNNAKATKVFNAMQDRYMPDFLLMFLLTLKNADFVNAAFKRSPQNKIHLWCRSHLLPSFLSPPAGDYQHPPHFLIFFFF